MEMEPVDSEEVSALLNGPKVNGRIVLVVHEDGSILRIYDGDLRSLVFANEVMRSELIGQVAVQGALKQIAEEHGEQTA